ncbi:MAG: ribosome maturation factor RimP [Propionibacteriaceae bacterium]|jgi:ribosome maturation factor RimP|nr:ribosome maturation factor RimP [Propionibacteriaceae bacterium]
MESAVRTSELRPVVEPVIEAQGLELEDLVIVRAGQRQIVRLTVDGDGPEGLGPDLDSIAAASRALSAVLDDSPLTGDRPYVLEVGSPGVGRPLTRVAQWRRNRGRLVVVCRRDGSTVTGRVRAVDAAGVSLERDGNVIELSHDDIVQAVVQAELTRSETGLSSSSPG